MKLKKLVSLATVATMLMGSAAFAEVPSQSIIIGSKAYDVNLLFDAAYKGEIQQAINAVPQGTNQFYYKINVMTQWRTIFGNTALTEEQIGQWPEITYIDSAGESTVYEAGNGEAVGENDAEIAAALDALDALDPSDPAVTDANLLAALQDAALGLENVVPGNAAEYFDDISDFQDAADSAADPLSGSVAAVQAIVDATNARVDVNAAINPAAMETAITAFVDNMTNSGILSDSAQIAFDTYTALADTEKEAVAKIMLSVRNDDLGFDANRWGLVYHSHNNGLQSVIEEMPEWINGINTALETVDDPATLEVNEQAVAVETALNNIPASLAVGSTNPNATSDYVYDAYYDLSPTDTDAVVAAFIAAGPAEFDSLAGILDALDAAIATLPAEE